MNSIIKVKRGFSSSWKSKNPILSKGELGYALDTKILKIGDGVSHWNDLTPLTDDLSAYLKKVNLPTALKNPSAIRFTGMVDVTYDGSLYKEINIPNPDTSLSKNSVNYVSNKAVSDALDNKINSSIADLYSLLNKAANNSSQPYLVSIGDNLYKMSITDLASTVKSSFKVATETDNGLLSSKDKQTLNHLATVATTGSYNDLKDKPSNTGFASLPVATDKVLGGVKIGSGIRSEADGTISVDGSSYSSSGYKGFISSYESLPTNPAIGDSYTLQASNTNGYSVGDTVIWSGLNWVNVTGESVDVSKFVTLDYLTRLNLLSESYLGVASGIAQLDSEGKVPSSQLPSYVDDVLEFNTYNDFPSEGEQGKIYVALNAGDTGKEGEIYRWSGTQYIRINSSVSSADTAVTASKLDVTYVGNEGTPVYFLNGLPVATTKVPSLTRSNTFENDNTFKGHSTFSSSECSSIDVSDTTTTNQLVVSDTATTKNMTVSGTLTIPGGKIWIE